MKAYNFQQRVQALNIFSNMASSKKGTPEELTSELERILNALFADKRIQGLIGQWTLEWGPVVGSYGTDEESKVASNALYVAKNEDGKYVVATAGTNPVSKYGWFTEDFNVAEMVLWPGSAKAPDAPMISEGTSLGLEHLLDMKSGGEDLLGFLNRSFASSDAYASLTVTGHSLGGALSAVLALRLYELQPEWNPAGKVVVSAQPSAGATPGNTAFSEYYGSQIGERTLRYWNNLDPVPHGWQHDMLEVAAFLYYPYLKPTVPLLAILATALEQSIQGTSKYPAGGPYLQLLPQNSPLKSQVNIPLTRPITASEFFQFILDMEIDKILAKIGISENIAKAAIAAINTMIQTLGRGATIAEALDWLKDHLSKIPFIGKELEKIIGILEVLVDPIQGVIIYLKQLAYQHVVSYFDLMNIAELQDIMKSVAAEATEGFTNPSLGLRKAAKSFGIHVENMMTREFLSQHGVA